MRALEMQRTHAQGLDNNQQLLITYTLTAKWRNSLEYIAMPKPNHMTPKIRFGFARKNAPRRRRIGQELPRSKEKTSVMMGKLQALGSLDAAAAKKLARAASSGYESADKELVVSTIDDLLLAAYQDNFEPP